MIFSVKQSEHFVQWRLLDKLWIKPRLIGGLITTATLALFNSDTSNFIPFRVICQEWVKNIECLMLNIVDYRIFYLN